MHAEKKKLQNPKKEGEKKRREKKKRRPGYHRHFGRNRAAQFLRPGAGLGQGIAENCARVHHPQFSDG